MGEYTDFARIFREHAEIAGASAAIAAGATDEGRRERA